MRCTAKSQLNNYITKDMSLLTSLASLPEQSYVVDAMAIIRMYKHGGTTTFGDVALMLYRVLTRSLIQDGFQSVHVIFD